jgi:hypothetical protein
MKYVPIIIPIFLILAVTAVTLYRPEPQNPPPAIKRLVAGPISPIMA